MKLGLWLIEACDKILAEVLDHYFVDFHILSALKEALNIVISGIFLLQTQNINLCLTAERALAPTIL